MAETESKTETPTAEEIKGTKRTAEDEVEEVKKQKTENGSSNGKAAVVAEANGAEDEGEEEEDVEEEEDALDEEDGEGEEDALDEEDGEEGEEEEDGEGEEEEEGDD